NITYSVGGGATGATVTGLPSGVTGTFSGSTFTISGTPTASGTFNYSVTTTGNSCVVATANGTLTVNPDNTITLSSAAGTDAQTKCINTAITTITYATTGATGATFIGLPTGVSGSWAGNVVTISGTPVVSGAFPYTVTLTGGCGTITKNGTITVNPDHTISLTSVPSTTSQTVCINTPIANITYSVGGGATGATVTGLPSGVTGTFSGSTFTISGTPTASGTFNYSVTTTGNSCVVATANGTITVNPNHTISLTSANNTQTVCINKPIANITYSVGGGATGATVTGLPSGVTGTFSGSTFSISGTPTASGTFNYSVTTTGNSCVVATANGTLTVNPDNTITLSSAAGTDAQTKCINTAITTITYATTGATGATFIGLPTGVSGSWAGNVVTISGTPVVSGAFPYTVTLTGGCGTITKNGTITVNPDHTISLTSVPSTTSQTVCINTPIANITYSVGGGATGATVTGLPSGVTGTFSGSTFTISGTPTASGTFNYSVTTTGNSCVVATANGTITVNPNHTISLTSVPSTTSQTVCINTPISNITYSVGGGATGATVTGLPSGVTGTFSGSTFTISGTPTASGTFNYTVNTTGNSCVVATANGTLTVNPDNTITLSSAAGTDAQTKCINTAITTITYATTGAT
ncbi:beta strand repeat-containing protein, partial [Parabacteroides sp. FAFU027]|uniref:beta strand repeat-containing protein n=1 Tax=Parabacteroides sp. FAFU027 TaxID=2922715 RepID=UPI001FAFB341